MAGDTARVASARTQEDGLYPRFVGFKVERRTRRGLRNGWGLRSEVRREHCSEDQEQSSGSHARAYNMLFLTGLAEILLSTSRVQNLQHSIDPGWQFLRSSFRLLSKSPVESSGMVLATPRCRSLMQLPPVTASPPKLLDRVRDAIRARHYSRRTEVAYVTWIRRYIGFHQMAHPSRLGTDHISAFLTWLATTRHVSASTQNQALAALLFLYERVLRVPIGQVEHVIRAKQPLRLPVVLSQREVVSVLAQLEGVMWIIGMLLYGSGLRLEECLALRVKDIDFDRTQITVRRGKGQKDRTTMLPSSVIDPLRNHLADVRRLHAADLEDGFGRVVLPDALERKYPHAATEWGWQFVFPASRMCRDPRWGPPSRFHLHESAVHKVTYPKGWVITTGSAEALATVRTEDGVATLTLAHLGTAVIELGDPRTPAQLKEFADSIARGPALKEWSAYGQARISGRLWLWLDSGEVQLADTSPISVLLRSGRMWIFTSTASKRLVTIVCSVLRPREQSDPEFDREVRRTGPIFAEIIGRITFDSFKP